MTRARYVREAVVQYRRSPDPLPIVAVTSSRDVIPLITRVIPDGPQEHFVALALDNKNRVVAWATVGIGTSNACLINPADVLRFCLLAGAPGLICAHNHPSGDPTPSVEDIQLTRRLWEACQVVGLHMLDHIVVGEAGAYVSFLDSGLMPRRGE